MKIGIASDHRGFELKNKIKLYLEKQNYEVVDYGTNTKDKSDYTKYAFLIGEAIKKQDIDLGVAICGTGIGMSIALNKVKSVMCANVSTKEEAYYAKCHNNVNAIAISGKMTFYKSKQIINKFLITEYDKDKYHQKRIDDIKKYEEQQ